MYEVNCDVGGDDTSNADVGITIEVWPTQSGVGQCYYLNVSGFPSHVLAIATCVSPASSFVPSEMHCPLSLCDSDARVSPVTPPV